MFAALSGHTPLSHPKDLSSQMHENMHTCIVHPSAQQLHKYFLMSQAKYEHVFTMCNLKLTVTSLYWYLYVETSHGTLKIFTVYYL